MGTRIVTGLILAGAVIAILFAAPPWATAALIVTVSGLCIGEVVGMFSPGRRLDRLIAVLGGVGMMSVGYASPSWFLHGVALAMFVAAASVLLVPEPIERAGIRIAAIWGSWVYICIPFGFALELTVNPYYVLLPCVVVFAGDTGAYFTGRALGKTKLYALISPKKTRAGAVGGLAASVALCLAMKTLFLEELAMAEAAALGLFGGLLGQTGDLIESMLKRACDVKDSGTILPGHGGMLDRVDGLIFALPLFALVLTPP